MKPTCKKIGLPFALSCLVLPVHAWTPSSAVPETQLDAFVSTEDVEVTAWATSPDLFNPTNIDIDHRGRLWALEGVNYRRNADRRSEGDRIVILEDTDGDGKADKSSVFWQDPELLAPLGIAVFDNVVIVSQPPHLLKLTDVNRDSKFEPATGDTREVLLTGLEQRVPKREIAERHGMKRSLMLNADQMGMSAQDVANVIEWMRAH